ncbi:hypothetical protein ACL02T_31490 [Pseudonocardia sp. RS010]|uniref:hypothetical protein n=1 Tax=Pseudonocardia sp. RS010 TaxID=3385979 RepID=UPI0039A3C862
MTARDEHDETVTEQILRESTITGDPEVDPGPGPEQPQAAAFPGAGADEAESAGRPEDDRRGQDR